MVFVKLLQGKTHLDLQFKFRYCGDNEEACLEIRHHTGEKVLNTILRHIGLLEADEDKIRKIRPKGTQVRMLYVPREAIRP